MNLVCTKCGESFKRLALFAMLLDAGARSSFDPNACEHDFEDKDLEGIEGQDRENYTDEQDRENYTNEEEEEKCSHQ